jgi:teichuronic acid biosynthesis glycosyltransferase TuaG
MESTARLIKPEVSIISPCFNSESYLQQMIDSVINQTYINWELILINDYSSDHTVDVIRRNVSVDSRIQFIDLPKNKGVANARNAGITKARGKYIAFLDSDDLWDADKLQKQVDFMKSTGCHLSYTAYRKMGSDSSILTEKIAVSEKGVSYRMLLKHNEIGCLTAMYNCEVIGKKYFMKVGHEDFVYWLSILKSGYVAYGLNTVLATYRVHQDTLSSNKIRAALFTWNIYRNIEKLSFMSSVINFLSYSVAAFKKFTSK